LRKSFGGVEVVRGVNIEIGEGELFFLLGPSGCGKTTCLRMTAGFETPTSGRVLFGGKDMTNTPPAKRNAGMVFQSYALFPHMSVEKNVGFGLRFRNMPQNEKAERVVEAMKRTRIEEFAKRLPAQLSGGQQQRVALARALVIRPDVLLLDEPLSNLDAALRAEMRTEIRRIHDELKITTIYVTHDQEEALTMADRIALMKNGEVVQLASPREIYFHPRNSFVASFVGKTNILRGRATKKQSDSVSVETPAGRVVATGGNLAAAKDGEEAALSLRPECIDVRPADKAKADDRPFISGKVTNVAFLGGLMRVELETSQGGLRLTADVAGSAGSLGQGTDVLAFYKSGDLVVLED